MAEQRTFPQLVRPATLHKYLGPPRHTHGVAEEQDEVGVATGLAWTSNGGDIMAIEITLMDGKGNLTLTGQLGDVMQESAQAALSYARTNARMLGIDHRRFEKVDIHIHVPEGAVPKDGPSAGITIATALISSFTGQRVRRDVAMTGEITLRGRVLPVGGIKEKVLGAYRAGIHTVLLPYQNERDMVEVPRTVQRKLRLIYARTMDDIREHALLPPDEDKPRRKTGKTPEVLTTNGH
jgi:ATP-dependent Lon protease